MFAVYGGFRISKSSLIKRILVESAKPGFVLSGCLLLAGESHR